MPFSRDVPMKNVENKIVNGKVDRKANAFGLAESIGRTNEAFRKNLMTTGASKKIVSGMSKPKREHWD